LYGVEGRYATALFSAASKENKLDAVENEVNAFKVRFITTISVYNYILYLLCMCLINFVVFR